MTNNIIFLNNIQKKAINEELLYLNEKLYYVDEYEEDMDYTILELEKHLEEEELTNAEKKSFENFIEENNIDIINNRLFYLEITKYLKIYEIRKYYSYIYKIKILNYINFRLNEIDMIELNNSLAKNEISKTTYQKTKSKLAKERELFELCSVKNINEYQTIINESYDDLLEIDEDYNLAKAGFYINHYENNGTEKKEDVSKKVLQFSNFKKRYN